MIVTDGFIKHSNDASSPSYSKERFNWLAYGAEGALVGALTCDMLWDWLYVDELWVQEQYRGQGVGRYLMLQAEEFAKNRNIIGLWLWTQSWQAESFYQKLGYKEFTRFNDFPRGHSRIGFRKELSSDLFHS